MTSIFVVILSILLMKIHGAALDTVNIGLFHATLPYFEYSNSGHVYQFLSIVNQFDLLFLSLSRSCQNNIYIFSAFLQNNTNYRVILKDRKGNSLNIFPIIYNPVKLKILECEAFDKTVEEKYIIIFCTVYLNANAATFTSIGFKTSKDKSIFFYDIMYDKMIANYMSSDRNHPIIFLGNMNIRETKRIFDTKLVRMGWTEFNGNDRLLFCHGKPSKDMIIVFGSMRSALVPGSTKVLHLPNNVLYNNIYTRCPVGISINPAELSNKNSKLLSVDLGQETPPKDNHIQQMINHPKPSRVTKNSFNIINPLHDNSLAQNTVPCHTQQTDYDHSMTRDDFPSTSYSHTYDTAAASNAVYNDANHVYCGNSQPIHYNQRAHDRSSTQLSVPHLLNPNGGSTDAFVPYTPQQSNTIPYCNPLSASSQGDNSGSGNYVENHSQPREYPQVYTYTNPSSLAHQQAFGSMNPFSAPFHDTYINIVQAGPSRDQPVEHTPGLMVGSSSHECAPATSARDCVQGDITYSSTGANFVSAYDCHKDYTERKTWNEEDFSFPSVIFDDNLPQI